MADEGLPINNQLQLILSLKPNEIYRGKEAKLLKKNLDSIQSKIISMLSGIDKIKDCSMDLRNEIKLATHNAIQQRNDHSKSPIKHYISNRTD